MADPKRSITPEDLYKFQIISDARISPDGSLAVFVQHRIDRKTEKKYADLWVVPTDGGEPRRFTHGETVDHTPRFSPDGTRIAFLSNRQDEKQFQIYVIPVAGGEAERLTDLKGSIQSFAWSPDGTRFVLQFRAKDAAAIEREEDEQKKKLGVVSRRITRVFFKRDEAGFLPEERAHVWLVDAESGEAKQLTSGDVWDEVSPAWSPDRKTIAFCSNRTEDPDLHLYDDEIYLIPADGGEIRKLPTPKGSKAFPSFSPDGRWIAFNQAAGEDPWAQVKVWVVRSDGSEEARCLMDDHDLDTFPWTLNDLGSPPLVPPTWTPDGTRILTHVAYHGRTALKALDLEGNLTDVIDEAGVVGAYSLDRAGEKLLYFYATMTDPGQLYVRDGIDGEAKVLTRLNRELLNGIDLGEIEEVWFKGSDGNDLQGWILTPPGFDREATYPSILEIHGGPITQYGYFFMHEFYVLAARGYVVSFSNPRGGQGYGDAHRRAIGNRWGTVDYDDLMAWTDLVASRSYVDPERMGVTGGSYGGYMTNWIIGRTDRFAAAVTQRSVSNLTSMWGSCDFNWAFQENLGKVPPWVDVENYWKQSPISGFANVKTPTLVIHSEGDLRCAIEQGEQVFVALKLLGVETEMIRYPDEPHGLSRGGRTDRRIDRLERIVGWFDRFLRDVA